MSFDELMDVWAQVNVAANNEDSTTIVNLIGPTGVTPNMHVGRDRSDFTPRMIVEWVLGQWLDMIESNSPHLGTARNVSTDQFDKLVAFTGWPS